MNDQRWWSSHRTWSDRKHRTIEVCGEFGSVRFLLVCFLYKTNPDPRKVICCGNSGPKATFNPTRYFLLRYVGLGLCSSSVSWSYSRNISGGSAKKRYTWSVWDKNRYILKNKVKNAPYELCHRSKVRCTCFRPDKAQVHPRLSTLLDFQLFFVVFEPIKGRP